MRTIRDRLITCAVSFLVGYWILPLIVGALS
jgi:hypothetical protein